MKTLITGGSTGIGFELATCFAEAHYDLVLVAQNEQRLNQASVELQKQFKVSVRTIALDLAQPGAGETLAELVKDEPIDVLVNNAGFAVYGPFKDNNEQKVIGTVRLNMETPTALTHRLLPTLITRRGKILNVASTAAFQPGPLMAVYYATKAYVLSWSEALRYELLGTGVTVTTLCPGPTITEFQHKSPVGNAKLFKLATPAQVVARVGFKGLMKGKPVIVPGFMNKLTTFGTRLVPRSLAMTLAETVNKP